MRSARSSLREKIVTGLATVFLLGLFALPLRAQDTVPATELEEGVLVVIDIVGGLCQYGGCWQHIEIHRQGDWLHREGDGSETMGTVDEAIAQALASAIAGADFAKLRENTYSDTCPSAYDGPQFIYSFAGAAGIEAIDSCETDLEGVALFLEIDVILELIYQALNG